MRLSAVDVASGEVFDALILPHTPPDDYELAQIGLPREALATARPLAEVLADFAAFCRRDAAPALTTWSGWTHGLLPELLPEARRILLKAELANRTHQRVPGLEVVVANLGLQVLPVPIPGRAGDRLALACALARHLASGPLP